MSQIIINDNRLKAALSDSRSILKNISYRQREKSYSNLVRLLSSDDLSIEEKSVVVIRLFEISQSETNPNVLAVVNKHLSDLAINKYLPVLIYIFNANNEYQEKTNAALERMHSAAVHPFITNSVTFFVSPSSFAKSYYDSDYPVDIGTKTYQLIQAFNYEQLSAGEILGALKALLEDFWLFDKLNIASILTRINFNSIPLINYAAIYIHLELYSERINNYLADRSHSPENIRLFENIATCLNNVTSQINTAHNFTPSEIVASILIAVADKYTTTPDIQIILLDKLNYMNQKDDYDYTKIQEILISQNVDLRHIKICLEGGEINLAHWAATNNRSVLLRNLISVFNIDVDNQTTHRPRL